MTRNHRWKKLAGLSFAFVACLLVGSGIFSVLEARIVKVNRMFTTEDFRIFQESVRQSKPATFRKFNTTGAWARLAPKCQHVEEVNNFLEVWQQDEQLDVEEMLLAVKQDCGNGTMYMQLVDELVPWGVIESMYFSMTVVTTIGFGHMTPKTAAGKIFCIVYALVGIPITGLLLAALGDTFSSGLMIFYERGFRFWQGGPASDPEVDEESADVAHHLQDAETKRQKLLFAALIYVLLGVSVFVFLPALVFKTIEGWPYTDSVYVAFVTLTTIGFGDLVPGLSAEDKAALDVVYKLVMILWVVIGLAYWATVFSFITKGLRAIKLKTLNAQARIAIRQLGIFQRDPKFVGENSRAAINLMIQMAQALGSTGAGTGAGGRALRSIPLTVFTEVAAAANGDGTSPAADPDPDVDVQINRDSGMAVNCE